MTGTQLILLGLVVIAALAAGYVFGRRSADREIGARSARPNPLPAPDDLDDGPAAQMPAPNPRQRGTPPPASAGGDYTSNDASPAPAPRQRSAAPPPAAASGDPPSDEAPRRAKRGPPPPAAAGVMGPGDTGKRNR